MNSRLPVTILLLSLATFAAGTEAYVYVGLLTNVAHDLNVTVASTGLLAAGFAVTYALTAPVLAALTGHWPRRPVLVAGLASVGILNLAAAASPSFAWLFASRITSGFIAALIGPSATATASTLAPPHMRGRALAIVGAGTGLAFTLGVPLGSAVGGLWGWRATFIFAGVLLLACAAALRLALPGTPRTDVAGLSGLRIVARREIAGHLGLTVSAFAATFSSMAFLGPIVERTAQAHGAGVGLFQAGIGIGSVLGLLLGGRLADGRRSAHAIPVLLGFVAITQLVLASIHSIVHESMLASALLATTIVGGAIALFALMPLVQSGLVSAAPDRRSVVLALNGSMVFLGQGLGALAGGLAANFNGVDATGVVGAAIAASAAVCAIVILRGRDATPTRSSAPLPEGIGS